MPTIAGLGAGSDSAYLNATRGRSDAYVSRSQAEQYSRQRSQVSEEMDLEQKKKRHFRENMGGNLRAARDIMGTVRYFR